MTNTLKTSLEAYKPEVAGELEKRLNAQAKVHTQ